RSYPGLEAGAGLERSHQLGDLPPRGRLVSEARARLLPNIRTRRPDRHLRRSRRRSALVITTDPARQELIVPSLVTWRGSCRRSSQVFAAPRNPAQRVGRPSSLSILRRSRLIGRPAPRSRAATGTA